MDSNVSRSVERTWRVGDPQPDDHPWRRDPVFRGFAKAKPRKLERNRLDIRLSDQLQEQINELTASLNVNATEVIRLAVDAMHTGQQARLSTASTPKALPSTVESVTSRIKSRQELRELDDLIEQTEREIHGN
jgi:hypothetical protein